MLTDLDEVLNGVDLDTVRALIITGAGAKSFVAGADISEMSTLTKEQGEAFGKKGNDLIIRVPAGTVVIDDATGKVMKDLVHQGDSFVAAKGGKGGKGNVNFKNSVRQAPNFAEAGGFAVERNVTLVLKLIADVGLLGFPNVGKSTFLSIISDARPKIANYHFTTLQPNLGVVDMGDGGGFVVADIPGIIEGAHEGVGLGHKFLRHVERTRVLLHIVDVSGVEGRDPLEDFDAINNELKLYSPRLAEKPQIVLANKMDIPSFADNYETFKEILEERGYQVLPISAATRQGMQEALNLTLELLSKLPKDAVEEEYEMFDPELQRTDETISVTVAEDGAYEVEGLRVRKIVGSTNFDDYESLQYFQRALIKFGVIAQLEDAGIQEGDTVRMYGVEFDFVK